MNRRLLLALAPAAALTLGAFAYAQPPGPGPGGHGGPVIRMIGPGGADMKAMQEAMMRQHVEDLKTVLRLRPDQEAALQAFVASHHAGGPMVMKHGPGGGAHGPAAAKPQTTPERLAAMARHEAAMAAEHEKSRQVLAKFYAALNPEQQRVFDALHRLQGHRVGGMGGHGGMRRIEIRRSTGGPAPAAEHRHD